MPYPEIIPASSQTPTPSSAVRRYFLLIVALIIVCGIARSRWATALDGFTFDEAYHIAAGATYLRLHDFRVNPEHPPLVKFVAGLAVPSSVLHLSKFHRFIGKEQEREYAETAVYLDSDPRVIQHRARVAMFAFHALLLLILAVLLKRLFNPGIALAALCLILLYPTVAAHLPVVMTDLPLALLGAISVASATLVLRDGRWPDAIFLGLAAALTLGTKHSALLVILPIVLGSPLYVVYLMALRRPCTRRGATGRGRDRGKHHALGLIRVPLHGEFHGCPGVQSPAGTKNFRFAELAFAGRADVYVSLPSRPARVYLGTGRYPVRGHRRTRL